LMHVAGALGKPGAVIFGPTTGHLGFFPYKSNIGVVENKNMECRPCTKQGHKKCPNGHFLCMKGIKVKDTVNEALSALKKTRE
jgi:ADP-heptose:LPS heptosyltransferase